MPVALATVTTRTPKHFQIPLKDKIISIEEPPPPKKKKSHIKRGTKNPTKSTQNDFCKIVAQNNSAKKFKTDKPRTPGTNQIDKYRK